MKAGKLRDRITIQSRTAAQGATGEVTYTWAAVGTYWASVTTAIGREYWAAKQVRAESSWKVQMRYVAGITAQMRVVYGSKTLGIDAPPIDVDERHRELVLMCTEALA